MNKLPILFSLSALALLFVSCDKERGALQQSAETSLIQHARRYFSDSVAPILPGLTDGSANPRISCLKVPLWDSAYTIPTVIGEAVVVPVRFNKSLHIRTNISGLKLFDLNELTRLVIYQDAGHRYHAEIVTSFPDSVAVKGGGSPFTGILFVEDWMGQRLHQFKFNEDGTILRGDESQGQTGKWEGAAKASTKVFTPDVAMTTCYEIDGYNYSEGDPDGGYAWSEPAGCSTSYLPDPLPLASTGGMSGSNYGSIAGIGPSALTVVISAGGSPIADIQGYFKCFTNSSAIDHTYTVTLCISQPVPGTSTPWGFIKGGPVGSSSARNLINVGHSFLIFTENSAGSVITRNVGFYPQAMVTPAYPSDQGQLENNEQAGYNISVTFNVSNSDFFAMLNYVEIGNNPGYLYNLNSNNCTTFALHALASGDISLSPNQGSWPGGTGYDPGDLGQYVVTMQLPKNATRNTVENPHPNTGSCN
jgi:hypothetical protein